jgi:hypothetical protein
MNWLLLLMNLAQAGDTATTAIALNRGCREAILPTQSISKIVAVKAGTTVGFTYTFHFMHKKTKQKTSAKIGAASVLVAGAVASVWNVRQLGNCR